ncbi:MAG TPA: biopolymer transporter ExbD [Candidatus Krumholzibacteria bacterium]|nr:biopolymer transporter ExbD [Candidatus Krumholzibacteria bacterium]
MGKKRIGIAIDMTPFVDIGFLLLIFFMSTTSFKPPEPIQLSLPSSNSEFKVPESDVLVLYVDKDGTLAIQLGLVAKEAEFIEAKDLATYVMNARARNPKLRMAIRADKDVPYGVMADVMKAMQISNTLRFNLVTELEQGTFDLSIEPSKGH